MYQDAYNGSVPEGTVLYSYFSCPLNLNSIDDCTATPASLCENGPLVLTCYNFTGINW